MQNTTTAAPAAVTTSHEKVGAGTTAAPTFTRRELFACSGDAFMDHGESGMDAPKSLPAGSVAAFDCEKYPEQSFAAPSIFFRDSLL